MPQEDVFYSLRFTNETDGGQPHFAVMKLDPSDKPEKHLAMLEANNESLKYDRKSIKRFNTRAEATAHNLKLAEDANAANPDRVAAGEQFPDAPNRILSAGSTALTEQA